MRPNRKLKKPDSSPKLILKEVVGLTAKNANRLTSNISNPNCVYVAGCVVVVYNVELDTQSHLMVSNRTPKPLSCVTMSKDGSFVAAGKINREYSCPKCSPEKLGPSCRTKYVELQSGHQTAVLVWDCASMALLSELKSHQYGVACTAFSPDGKHLGSVGFSRDGYICLWDWRSAMLVTKVKSMFVLFFC
ncbi:uncharacterized protein LOC130794414 isoform X2 [Actinidia eriantha]|uniref:uncharacterized protein LOC130794414 isoform X2 n=1 Tax=Actinidia eriantha TaxID=165200 RepID=UPI0025886C54|nr:uncharacterized protein LOC130794414 isoform X2 [Actinidia eriantha]XP_057512318.1 uncharacterized protein LOC130794414 isoform X2 [Actinidia eriantha]